MSNSYSDFFSLLFYSMLSETCLNNKNILLTHFFQQLSSKEFSTIVFLFKIAYSIILILISQYIRILNPNLKTNIKLKIRFLTYQMGVPFLQNFNFNCYGFPNSVCTTITSMQASYYGVLFYLLLLTCYGFTYEAHGIFAKQNLLFQTERKR